MIITGLVIESEKLLILHNHLKMISIIKIPVNKIDKGNYYK